MIIKSINEEIKFKKLKINLSTLIIFIISIFYSQIIGFGLYGYGRDYYAGYFKHNLDYGGIFDRLGYVLSTFSINQIHLGVHIVTFILCFSVGILIKERLKLYKNYSPIFFVTIFLIVIHTWPIIMSTSNAMRQGLSMSFIFLALASSSQEKYYRMLLSLIISVFMHKSGLFLSLIILLAYHLNFLFLKIPHSYKIIFSSLIGFFLYFASYYTILNTNFLDDKAPGKIIEGDYRWVFILLSIMAVFLSLIYRKIIDNPFNLSLFYFSFIFTSVLITGHNWEYERLGMMMIIPYIFFFGCIIKNNNSYKIYLLTSFSFLLFMTFYTGMYASLY